MTLCVILLALVALLLTHRKIHHMSKAFDALISEVAQAQQAMASAVLTIQALVAKIPNDENVIDPAQATAATDALKASADALTAAAAAALPVPVVGTADVSAPPV